MAEESAKDILLHDPLSEVTRKERRMLLGVSMLGVALVKTGLIPTKISALGVEFDQSNQKALLGLLALVVTYFFAAFLIYAAADFLAWRRAFHNYIVSRVRERRERRRQVPQDLLEEEEAEIRSIVRSGDYIYRFARPVSALRAVFEFVLPIGVGAYAVLVLVRA